MKIHFIKKCHPKLRSKVNNELWIINAVTNLIINRYKPEKVKLNINMVYHLDAFKSDGDIFDKFNDSYEITRNDKNRVSNAKPSGGTWDHRHMDQFMDN